MKIAIIGGGNLGTAIAQGLLCLSSTALMQAVGSRVLAWGVDTCQLLSGQLCQRVQCQQQSLRCCPVVRGTNSKPKTQLFWHLMTWPTELANSRAMCEISSSDSAETKWMIHDCTPACVECRIHSVHRMFAGIIVDPVHRLSRSLCKNYHRSRTRVDNAANSSRQIASGV